jgi:hypothetical protein
MSKFTQPVRSVRDIKTLAGKSDDLLTPHKMYMRLFALETERHRRQQERASAMLRVASIDTRCAEIDQEKQELLRHLGVESIPLAPSDDEALGAPANPIADPRRRPRAGRLAQQSVTAPVEMPVYEAVKIRY